MNQVVPVKYNDMYDNSFLRHNIKSMYCKDFITTAEENAEIFKDLFDKLNDKINQENIQMMTKIVTLIMSIILLFLYK